MLNNVMSYKGYFARIEYDPDADSFHGRVLGIQDMIDFFGRSPAELRREMRNSVEEYLAWCKEDGVAPEKTWQGKLTIRPSEDLRRRLAVVAAAKGQSVNSLVTAILERETERELGTESG